MCKLYGSIFINLKNRQTNLLVLRIHSLGGGGEAGSNWRKCSISQLGVGYKTVQSVKFHLSLCLICVYSHICIILNKVLKTANDYTNVWSSLK